MANEMLSEEQVLLLENLMYLTNTDPLKSVTGMGEGKTVADLVNIDFNSLSPDKDYGSFMTGKDWQNLLRTVQKDKTLMNMQIASTHVDWEAGGGGGESAVFLNPDTREAVVAFRGTAGNEWKDDFVGGAATDTYDGVSTQQQINALEWYKSLELDDYGIVTVTGHSKGGNKAKYITVMDGTVDRCISFDGQGFSDEFMSKYEQLIASRQDKIRNCNAEYDYVNLLLNDIGNTSFYQGYDFGEGGFLENHCPNTLIKFNEDGTWEMITVEGRAREMEELDKFLNSYLRSLSGEDKKMALEAIGMVVEQGFNNATLDDILDTLLEGNTVNQMAYLLAYLIRYEQETPGFTDSIRSILNKFGMNDFVKVVDIVDAILEWEYFDNVVGILNWAVDGIPDWILEKLLKFLNDKFGISLTVEEGRKLLSVIGKIDTNLDTIKITHNGEDIVVESTGVGSFSIKIRPVNEIGEDMRHMSRQINNYRDELADLTGQIQGTKDMRLISLRLKNTVNRLMDESKSMQGMAEGIEEILTAYSDAEKRIINHTGSMRTSRYD